MRIDLHTHSRVSDGTDTPTTLVMKAFAAELDVIALTDHDTFGGVLEAQEAGKRIGVKVLCGIEMSTVHNGKSVHLLGYGCDMYDRALNEELARIRFGRSERLPAMVAKLNEAGLELTMEDVMTAAAGAPVVGRPHVAAPTSATRWWRRATSPIAMRASRSGWASTSPGMCRATPASWSAPSI